MIDRLALLVPSRGRPKQAAELGRVIEATATRVDLILGLDDDDEDLVFYPDRYVRQKWVAGRVGLGGTLNAMAQHYATRYTAVGFMGDDHRPRTPHWDGCILGALQRPSFPHSVVYGNDLFQGANLPTAVFMSSDTVRRLGWFAPPGIRHLYLDNAWKALGERLGTLTYLPDVIIEHMHPHAGKAEWDDGYRQSNSSLRYEQDAIAFNRWMADDLDDAVKRVLA